MALKDSLDRRSDKDMIGSRASFTIGDFEDGFDGRRVRLGVCAMQKKVSSKPMMEIITRLQRLTFLDLIVFSENIIVNDPVEKWPIVDCLISFYSSGFPLDKAVQYEQLRSPKLINDLKKQYDLMDRTAVHRILKEQGIEQPKYAVVDRARNNLRRELLASAGAHSEGDAPCVDDCDTLAAPCVASNVVEMDDYIEVGGLHFSKPFVEKPVAADDHNIFIYYPSSAGGGSQRLFRKTGNRSSVYSPASSVRTEGSYIYEEFMPTDGTDVKVYTVGPDYAHAEARKSPALDGKVERDKSGKEVRYPVILTAREKTIARKICMAFKQTICGFDLLRANGTSYVCDVNGFSFVKTSPKYYDDCATIIGTMTLRMLAPSLSLPLPPSIADPEVPPIMPTTAGAPMELRCLIGIIRHGDRTPKQKMKMEVKDSDDVFSTRFFALFEKYGGRAKGQLKMKQPRQLQEVLDIARELLATMKTQPLALPPELEERRTKLLQLKTVLEMYGHFSGINRKIQLKYQPHGYSYSGCVSDVTECDGSSSGDCPGVGGSGGGVNGCCVNGSASSSRPSLLLVLKWGGELTAAGKTQAEELGKAFRCMYPSYGETPGLGLLRLHSTFRHDLKIYASDEGRVQMTAAAFAKGFLALEGELTPILVQMVKSGSHINGLLDNADQARPHQRCARKMLMEMVNLDRSFTEDDAVKFNPCGATALVNAMEYVKNPRQCCLEIACYMKALIQKIRLMKVDPKYKDRLLYHGENWELMLRRWSKLDRDFCRTPGGLYDVSKIPDIYDCIKYDLHHNQRLLEFEDAEVLYTKAKALADIVIPQEYGVHRDEKLAIAASVSTPLLRKIKADLLTNAHEGDSTFTMLDSRLSTGVSSPDRHVRTRLYFTSESHIHTMLSLIRFGGLSDEQNDPQWLRAIEYMGAVSELNYMTQIVIMMYEDPSKDPKSDERFHLEIHFSPGAYGVDGVSDDKYPLGCGYRPVEARAGSPNLSRIHSAKDMVTAAGGSSQRVFDKDPFGCDTLSGDMLYDRYSDNDMPMEDLQEEEEEDEDEYETRNGTTASRRIFINKDDDDASADDAVAESTSDGSATLSHADLQSQAGAGVEAVQLGAPPRWRRRLSGGSENAMYSSGHEQSTSGEASDDDNEDNDREVERSSTAAAAILRSRRSVSPNPPQSGTASSHRSRGSSGRKGSLARSFEDKFIHGSVGIRIQDVSASSQRRDSGQLVRTLRNSCLPPAAASPLVAAAARPPSPVQPEPQAAAVLARPTALAAAAALDSCVASSVHTWPAAAPCGALPPKRRQPLWPLLTPHVELLQAELQATASAYRKADVHASDMLGLHEGDVCKERHLPHQQSFCFGSQRCTGCSTLISTRVISGSYSAPNLQHMDHSLGLEAYGMAVPEIRPLETLHNALNLAQFEVFLDKVMDRTIPSPPSRSFPPTPTEHYRSVERPADSGSESATSTCTP